MNTKYSIFNFNIKSLEELVFTEVTEALKAVKAHPGARFKHFTSKKEAIKFAMQSGMLIGLRPDKVK